MTAHAPFNATQSINKLAKAASELGYEIVDIYGFLGLVETHAVQQREALAALLINVEQMANANSDATDLAQSLRTTSQQAQQDVSASVSSYAPLVTGQRKWPFGLPPSRTDQQLWARP
jgi:methyl-accepting chemotaxis protein